MTKFTQQVLKAMGEVEIIALRLAGLVMLLYLVWQFITRH